MSSGWRTATLSEICDFYNGLWKGEKPPFVNVGVIRNTNFAPNGMLDDSDIAYLDVEEKKLEKRRLQFGDIILEKSGGGPKQPVGRVALFDKTDGIFSFSNFTSALRVRDPTQVDFRFLHKFLYWTHFSGKTEAIQSHSTGIRNLDSDAYKALEIAIPPLQEQKRIVELLDQSMESIETASAFIARNILNTEVLFDRCLNDALENARNNWQEVSLSDICEIQSTLIDPRSQQYRNLPHVGGANIISKTGELIDLKTAKEEGLISGKFLIDDTMTLYSKIRPYLMKVARPQFEGLCSADIYPLSPKRALLSRDFLFYVLLSQRFTQYAEDGSARAGMPKVNREHLFAYRLLLPPIDEQQAIADRLDKLSHETRHLKQMLRRKDELLAGLQSSVFHQAFAGAF